MDNIPGYAQAVALTSDVNDERFIFDKSPQELPPPPPTLDLRGIPKLPGDKITPTDSIAPVFSETEVTIVSYDPIRNDFKAATTQYGKGQPPVNGPPSKYHLDIWVKGVRSIVKKHQDLASKIPNLNMTQYAEWFAWLDAVERKWARTDEATQAE